MTTGMVVLMLAAASASGQQKGAGSEPLAVAPFDLAHEVILVTASVGNSGPLQMALDTGSHTTLDEAVARRIGLDLSFKALSSGIKGRQEISIVKGLPLHFSGAEITEPVVVVYSLDFLSKRIGRQLDGIVGIEFFRSHVVEIDYGGKQFRVWDPRTFVYRGSGESLPLSYYGKDPIVAGSVTPFGKAPIPTHYMLDTGGSGTNVVFWEAFYTKHDILSGVHDPGEVQQTEFGGTHAVKRGRVQSITVGGITVADADVRFSAREMGDPDRFGGNLGSAFFRRYKPIFDLPHDRVIFEKQP